MIGIISAMDIEMEHLINQLQEGKKTTIGATDFFSGKLFDQPVVLAVCGPGKVNAALCAQGMILHFNPSKIINLGVAGALAKKLAIGDIVIGTACAQHDFDTSALGEPLGLIPVVNKCLIPCDPAMVAAMERAVLEMKEVQYHLGIIATGDQFVAGNERKEQIMAVFNGICCEMEGGAIAQACYLHQVPFIVIRAISDGANTDAHMDYPTFKAKAALTSGQLMARFLANEGRGH